MPYSAAAKNTMLDALAPAFLSLHTGAPGSTGATEVTGGSPAYARKSATWSAASAGSKALSNSPVFDVPAGTISAIGLWTAVTGGTYLGFVDVTDEVYAAQGTYTVTAGSIDLNATASA